MNDIRALLDAARKLDLPPFEGIADAIASAEAMLAGHEPILPPEVVREILAELPDEYPALAQSPCTM